MKISKRKTELLEQEKEIVEIYKKGIKPKNIKNYTSFICSYQRILRVFKKYNLQKEGSGGKNAKFKGNLFFKHTEESDYWLGYLLADGSLSKNKYNISIVSKDIEHLIKYKNFINSNLIPFYRKNEVGNTIINVYFGSKESYEYLNKLGVTNNKSKTLKFNYPLNNNILRGIFDGDGSISQNRPKITTGSLNFKNQIEDYYKSLSINFTTTVKNKTNDTNTFDIIVLKDSRKKLYELMYKNSTVFLERKKDKFRAVVEKSTI